jgi:hypothetical protein
MTPAIAPPDTNLDPAIVANLADASNISFTGSPDVLNGNSGGAITNNEIERQAIAPIHYPNLTEKQIRHAYLTSNCLALRSQIRFWDLQT